MFGPAARSGLTRLSRSSPRKALPVSRRRTRLYLAPFLPVTMSRRSRSSRAHARIIVLAAAMLVTEFERCANESLEALRIHDTRENRIGRGVPQLKVEGHRAGRLYEGGAAPCGHQIRCADLYIDQRRSQHEYVRARILGNLIAPLGRELVSENFLEFGRKTRLGAIEILVPNPAVRDPTAICCSLGASPLKIRWCNPGLRCA